MAMVQVDSYNFATVENPLSDGSNFSIIADVDFTGSLQTIAGNLCEPTGVAAIGGAEGVRGVGVGFLAGKAAK